MSWGAVAGAAIGAVTSYVGAKKKAKRDKEAAEAASQPTYFDRTTEKTPWGASEGHRVALMDYAMGLLGSGSGGGPGVGGGGRAAARMARREARRERREGGGGGGQPGYIPAASYIQDILGGKYLEGNPHLDAAIEASQRGINLERDQNLARIDMAAEGAGRTRGGGAVQIERGTTRGKALQLSSDIDSKMRFEDYNNRMNDLMTALGLGTQWDIAKMQDKTNRRGQTLAHRASMAGINLDRQMLPFQKAGAVANIIETMSGNYGTVREHGMEQGQPQVAAYSDPLLEAFQGGYGGAVGGHKMEQMFRS